MIKYFFLIISVLYLTSCASYFKRKDCESTNWFQYGESVALEGRRLTGDQFINECEQADADIDETAADQGFKSGMAKYCLPDVVFQTGKNGHFFNTEMCVGENIKSLQLRHRDGVTEYCQRGNAYGAGAKGKPYNKICPAALEAQFLPEFNRGRKRYLSTLVAENQRQISKLNSEVNKLEGELRYKKAEFQGYQYSNSTDERIINRMNELSREMNNIERELSSKKSESSRLQSKNSQLQVEIVQLDN